MPKYEYSNVNFGKFNLTDYILAYKLIINPINNDISIIKMIKLIMQLFDVSEMTILN